MTQWTEKAEQLRRVIRAGDEFLARWAAETLLAMPLPWEKLRNSVEQFDAATDTELLRPRLSGLD